MNVTVILVGRDPITLDWPRDLPMPRIGEALTLHVPPTETASMAETFRVKDLQWDASDPFVYPILVVVVE